MYVESDHLLRCLEIKYLEYILETVVYNIGLMDRYVIF